MTRLLIALAFFCTPVLFGRSLAPYVQERRFIDRLVVAAQRTPPSGIAIKALEDIALGTSIDLRPAAERLGILSFSRQEYFAVPEVRAYAILHLADIHDSNVAAFLSSLSTESLGPDGTEELYDALAIAQRHSKLDEMTSEAEQVDFLEGVLQDRSNSPGLIGAKLWAIDQLCDDHASVSSVPIIGVTLRRLDSRRGEHYLYLCKAKIQALQSENRVAALGALLIAPAASPELDPQGAVSMWALNKLMTMHTDAAERELTDFMAKTETPDPKAKWNDHISLLRELMRGREAQIAALRKPDEDEMESERRAMEKELLRQKN